jgi:hypothetical protein
MSFKRLERRYGGVVSEGVSNLSLTIDEIITRAFVRGEYFTWYDYYYGLSREDNGEGEGDFTGNHNSLLARMVLDKSPWRELLNISTNNLFYVNGMESLNSSIATNVVDKNVSELLDSVVMSVMAEFSITGIIEKINISNLEKNMVVGAKESKTKASKGDLSINRYNLTLYLIKLYLQNLKQT